VAHPGRARVHRRLATWRRAIGDSLSAPGRSAPPISSGASCAPVARAQRCAVLTSCANDVRVISDYRRRRWRRRAAAGVWLTAHRAAAVQAPGGRNLAMSKAMRILFVVLCGIVGGWAGYLDQPPGGMEPQRRLAPQGRRWLGRHPALDGRRGARRRAGGRVGDDPAPVDRAEVPEERRPRTGHYL
jgi:hypothetical protein